MLKVGKRFVIIVLVVQPHNFNLRILFLVFNSRVFALDIENV